MQNSIAVDGVTYYRNIPINQKAQVAIDKWEYIISEIAQYKKEAQHLYDDMRENGLTASSIEAEGYLRAMLQIANTVKTIEDTFK